MIRCRCRTLVGATVCWHSFRLTAQKLCWMRGRGLGAIPRSCEQFESYLATVVLGAHLQRLPAEQHEEFIRAVAARVAEPVVDYVRLNIRARRA